MFVHFFVYACIAIVYVLASKFFERRAKRAIGDCQLVMPSIIVQILTPNITFGYILLLYFFYTYWPSVDKVAALIKISVGFIMISILYYYCFLRNIYWNKDGIGLISPINNKFIKWDNVISYRKDFMGIYHVESLDSKLFFNVFQQQHNLLNSDIRKYIDRNYISL